VRPRTVGGRKEVNRVVARIIGLMFSATVAALSGWVALGVSRSYINAFEYVQRFRYFPQTYSALFSALGLIVGFTIAALIYRQALDLSRSLLSDLRRIPGQDKAAVILGIFIGLGLTSLLGMMLIRVPQFGAPLVLLVGIACVYFGVAITLSMKEELHYFFPGLAARTDSLTEEQPSRQPKLLDTNVIIDGRIADISRAGFIEGPVYVPGFVLDELHLIADSSDSLKRNRGRRGLDILNQMQQDLGNHVSIFEDYGGVFNPGEAVDTKLVQLAKKMEAAIVTNDFNLNKVAQLQGVRVLNVNELANAVKPVVLPGEELNVTIVREGREPDQGVAYLDDGTMVVVEHGKERVGGSVRIVVTSVLQTVAGKMIFGNVQNGSAQGLSGSQENSHRDHRADSVGGTRRKARPS